MKGLKQAGVLAVCLLTAGAAAHADGRAKWEFIEGTWRVEVTPRACDSAGNPVGNPLGSSFPTFNTYHRGGTLSEHGSRMPPSQRGSGHGIWRRSGYAAFDYRMAFQVFDVSGALTATQNIGAELQMRGANSFTGKARFTRTDLSGNVSPPQCATLAGARMVF